MLLILFSLGIFVISDWWRTIEKVFYSFYILKMLKLVCYVYIFFVKLYLYYVIICNSTIMVKRVTQNIKNIFWTPPQQKFENTPLHLSIYLNTVLGLGSVHYVLIYTLYYYVYTTMMLRSMKSVLSS